MFRLFLLILVLFISPVSVFSKENIQEAEIFFENDVMSSEYGNLNGYFNLPKNTILNKGVISLNISTTVDSITEASEIVVFLNGVKKNEFNLIGGSYNKQYTIEVDEDFKIGLNKISLMFSHKNRFSCNIEDIYNLWSKIENSKFEYESNNSLDNNFFISDFYNEILSSGNSNKSISLLFPSSNVDNDIISLSSMLSQGIKVRSIYKSPTIKNNSLNVDNLEQLNIVVGVKDEILDFYNNIDNPNIFFKSSSGPSMFSGIIDNKKILFLTGDNISELKTIVYKFASKNMNFPFSSYYKIDINKNLSYEFNKDSYLLLKQNVRYYFDEIGIPDIYHNHIFNTSKMNFNLPANFLSIPSDKVIMNLTGKYLKNLTSDSRLEIYLNSNLVSVILLNNINGDSFENYKLYIPVKYLKPYNNEFKFVSKINQYGPCFKYIDNKEEENYLFIDSKLSNLKIPNYSEIINLPNLSLLYSSSTPYYLDKNNSIYLFNKDWEDLDFASNILGDLAKSSSKVSFYKGYIYNNISDIYPNNSIFFGSINNIPNELIDVNYLNKINIRNSFLSFDKLELLENNNDDLNNNKIMNKYNYYKSFLYKDSFMEAYSKSKHISESKIGAIFQRASIHKNKVWTFYILPENNNKSNFLNKHNKKEITNNIKGNISLLTSNDDVFSYENKDKYYLFSENYTLKDIRQVLSNYIDNNLLQSIIIIVLLLIFLGGTTYFFVKKIGNNK